MTLTGYVHNGMIVLDEPGSMPEGVKVRIEVTADSIAANPAVESSGAGRARFASTSYFVALVNARDKHHAQAVAVTADEHLALVTTDYIVIELGNYFRRPQERGYFLAVLGALAAESTATVVPASRDLQKKGFELYSARPDKSWSLTDCLSFVVMDQLGLAEALTTDRHFEQAGFAVLLG